MSLTQLMEHVLAMGLAVEPLMPGDVLRAAELIAHSRAARDRTEDSLSLGDGTCLAVAERLGLPVTGGDRLWADLPLTVRFLPFRR
jgi:ribonuclease VapC